MVILIIFVLASEHSEESIGFTKMCIIAIIIIFVSVPRIDPRSNASILTYRLSKDLFFDNL